MINKNGIQQRVYAIASQRHIPVTVARKCLKASHT